VAEELLPFRVGGGAVFLAGSQGPSAGQERQVGLDRLVRVGGLVPERDVDVAMPGNDLGDVRGQAVEDGVCDEHATEIVRRVVQRLPVDRVDQAGVGQRTGQQRADAAERDRPVLRPDPALEQHGCRRQPQPFPGVVGGHQGDCSGLPVTDPVDDRGEDLGEFGTDDQEPFGVCLRRHDL
jgi:hypothetical protein